MPLPDPKQFNFKLLLQRLQKKCGDEITRELLSQFLNDGIIKGEPIRQKLRRGGGFVPAWFSEHRGQPVYYVDGPIVDYSIPLAEVLRFETEYLSTPAKPEPATTTKTKATTTTENGSDKVQRNDALNKIVIQIRADYIAKNGRTPQYNEVVNKLKSLCTKGASHPVLQEITGGVIYWINRNGKEKETPIRELQKRLTRLNAV